MNFSLSTNGASPGPQSFELRNAGSGTLNWTAVPSTADGGAWLSVSSLSGTAPSVITVRVLSQNLPGGAATGTYSGSILFESANSTVSIPITVSVGVTGFEAINGVATSMLAGGNAPNPEAVNISATKGTFYFDTTAYTANGGNWLTVESPTGNGYTSSPVVIGFNNAVVSSLSAGTYTGEVVVANTSTGNANALDDPCDSHRRLLRHIHFRHSSRRPV